MPFGFYSSGTIIIPPMPKWPAGPLARCTIADLKIAIQRHSPGCQFGLPKDSDFILTPTEAVMDAVKWTLRALAAQGITYTPESWDCENFVNEADQTLRKMAALAGIKASPLTCVLSVQLVNPWGGTTGPGMHALMGTMTDAGLMVSEAENGQTCGLELYPNRSTILTADNF